MALSQEGLLVGSDIDEYVPQILLHYLICIVSNFNCVVL